MDRASGKRELVTVKRASLFRGVMKQMGDEQWNHIVQAALAMRPQDFKAVKQEDGAVLADEESDDTELLDPRYM